MTTEILLTVEQHTDTETGDVRVGEIDFGIRIGQLESYLKRYRYEGKKEIINTLAFLIYKVEDEYMKMMEKSPNNPPQCERGTSQNLAETTKA